MRACGLSLLVCLALLALDARAQGPRAPLELRILVEARDEALSEELAALRGAVLESVAQQVPDDAMAGLWSYAGVTRRLNKPGPVTGLWRQLATIYAQNMPAGAAHLDLDSALELTLKDWDDPARQRTHVLLIGSGRVRSAGEDTEDARRSFLNSWRKKLVQGRFSVHSLVLGGEEDAPGDVWRQLAEATDGWHARVRSAADVNGAVVNWLRRLQLAPEALVDDEGRFQVPPGTEQFTVLWPYANERHVDTALVRPNGTVLNRTTPLPAGRWLLAADYEIATIEAPEPGWWQLSGLTPERVSMVTDLDIQIEGVTSPVLPSEETSGLVRLYSDGRLVQDEAFLGLVDLRVWLVEDNHRVPLPVERNGPLFEAFFVNIDDGAYHFEVQVVGPTFAQVRRVPFVAQNPLRVEVRQVPGEDGVAWLSFNHPEISYATVKGAAKVRKPPQAGVLVPAEKMPNGLWRLPLGQRDGIFEVAFSVSGNYLNNKGFFLKTKPVPVALPLAEGSTEVYRFDASGKRLTDPSLAPAVDVNEPPDPAALLAGDPVAAPGTAARSDGAPEAEVLPPPEPPAPLIPLWFVAAVTLLNLLIGAFVWWLYRPAPLALEPVAEAA